MLKQKEHNGMTEHKYFDELVEKTGSDATFEKSSRHEPVGKWFITLYHYTPGMNISWKRGRLFPNYCPICGEDLR